MTTPEQAIKPTSKIPVESEFTHLAAFYLNHEDWLMERVLDYAKRQDYCRYTSTLVEAWRLSIHGISTAFSQAAAIYDKVPELHPDEVYCDDPVAAFGVEEARKHRERGINLSMFLGLFKYYRQTYQDLLAEKIERPDQHRSWLLYTDRLFDRFELAFLNEWNQYSEPSLVAELQSANRDITNRKSDFLTMLETISEGVIVFNPEGRARYANLAAGILFNGKQIPGTGQFGQTNERRLEAIPPLAQFKKLVDEEGLLEVERDGKHLCFGVKMRELLDISGKFNGKLVILNDQTHYVEQSKQLTEQCAALTEALSELEKTQQYLVQTEKMSSIGQLAAGIAHEINNPMGFISSNVNSFKQYSKDLLKLLQAYQELKQQLGDDGKSQISQLEREIDADYLEADLADLIKETQDGCQRVCRIVSDLKDFSRAGEGKIGAVDIEKCIESAINVAWNQIKYKATVKREYGNAGVIKCDAGQIGQVLVNLLVNAADAIDRQGTIRVGTHRTADSVTIEVEDSGCGIDPKQINQLFEPFFTTKPVGSGTGLGLYISHQIVERHGGEIRVSSEPGQGSMFEIVLPIAAKSRAADS
ncbi:sensor histidine kinase [Motiliproteus sediminis]|uniref:sensor histidine kinase n=1 Tax=Motiliproteus sediminis TaxID=1468178 RepID=UPI001AEFFC0F|nr:ATP-binding protein [Motiliproteus sediminis]